jgi:hypothetical protein
MGAEQKCSLFRSPEIVSMARESATVTWTAPVPPAREMLSFVRDPMP